MLIARHCLVFHQKLSDLGLPPETRVLQIRALNDRFTSHSALHNQSRIATMADEREPWKQQDDEEEEMDETVSFISKSLAV